MWGLLVNLELPEGPEKKIVCLKDRENFVSDFEELEELEKGELEFQPELLKKDDSGLIPGEIILLAWCSGKNTKKRFLTIFIEDMLLMVLHLLINYLIKTF